jgi:hypothetical protein
MCLIKDGHKYLENLTNKVRIQFQCKFKTFGKIINNIWKIFRQETNFIIFY